MNELTNENYFSQENDLKYMGSTQFKRFVQELGGCEKAAMARYNNTPEWKEYIDLIGGETNDAFLAGSYLHSWNDGTIEKFREENPSLYSSRGKTAGQLKSTFRWVADAAERLEKDKVFMQALEGEKEVIFTGELFGMQWKVMLDSINAPKGYFTDLKSSKDIHGKYWSDIEGRYVNFIQHWRYDIQSAIYAAVEKASSKRDQYLYPHIAVTDKGTPINDFEVIVFESEGENYVEFIERTLAEIEPYAERVRQVKYEGAEPLACGTCDYCKSKKKLKSVISWKDIEIR